MVEQEPRYQKLLKIKKSFAQLSFLCMFAFIIVLTLLNSIYIGSTAWETGYTVFAYRLSYMINITGISLVLFFFIELFLNMLINSHKRSYKNKQIIIEEVKKEIKNGKRK